MRRPPATTASALRTAVLVRLTEATNQTLTVPLVVFSPTSRCNSRCVSCDWWKQSGADDMPLEEIAALAGALPALGTRVVAFTGGEPLLRPDVFEIAALFRARGMALQLLTSGVLLDRFADRVAQHFARVFVSLDAADERLYERVRGVNALGNVVRGVARLRERAPHVPIGARATLHRANFRELPRLVAYARTIGLDGISFLAADLSETAFGREQAPDASPLRLDRDEVAEFRAVVEAVIEAQPEAFAARFVAESPDKLRRLPAYYAALNGDGPFPPVSCNAPWVSIVVEANGAVRPCFFHAPVGNLRRTPIESIVRDHMPAFRAALNMTTDAICERCVCSLKTTWRSAPWIG